MDKRLLTITEAAHYLGIGKTAARRILQEMGAIVRFGRSVRYDVVVIDRKLNRMTEG